MLSVQMLESHPLGENKARTAYCNCNAISQHILIPRRHLTDAFDHTSTSNVLGYPLTSVRWRYL